MRRSAVAVGLWATAVLISAASAAAESGVTTGIAGARAFTVQVLIPDEPAFVVGVAEAPPEATAGGAVTYPADGSIVTISSSGSTLTAKSGAGATASASVDIGRISLFRGEITADAAGVRVQVKADAEGASGDFSGSGLTNLVALWQPVSSAPAELKLGDWGRLLVLSQSTDAAASAPPGYRGILVALDVHIDADHGGLPAGSRIMVGYGEAWGTAAAPAPVETTTPEPTTTTAPTTTERAPLTPPVTGAPKQKTVQPVTPRAASRIAPSRVTRSVDERLRPPEPDRLENGRPSPFRVPPTNLTPKLTAGGYVFPVYGQSAYTDTFGAPRADVSYHHGDDIFAPLGAPVLAVANGTVFSVGWNDIGGNRLWLRDDEGNQFYYAHLSAFSTLAVNGKRVKAGDVLGFVGATGDAVGTPTHLHFEIHPVELLFLGYDGAVNPSRYLNAWRRLEDVQIRAAVGGGPGFVPVAKAPVPGAILLQSTDISTANGLEPDSLRKALAPSTGDGATPPLVDLGRS